MSKVWLFALACCCASCGVRGVVVYHKVQGRWEVKEVHLPMNDIDGDAVKQGENFLNGHLREELFLDRGAETTEDDPWDVVDCLLESLREFPEMVKEEVAAPEKFRH